MALQHLRDIDVYPLLRTGNYTDPDIFMGAHLCGTLLSRGCYYDRLDVLINRHAGGGGTGAQEFVRLDPQFLSNTGTLFDEAEEPGNDNLATAGRGLWVGEWDKSANTQRVYALADTLGAGHSIWEVQPLALNVNVAGNDAWPNVGTYQTRNGGLTSTTPGFYTTGDSNGVVFETQGYIFRPHMAVRHTDNVTYTGVPGLIDLTTGAATILTGFQTSWGSQTHKFAAPQLFGLNVDFTACQFVQDDTSTPSLPKGQMWMFSRSDNSPIGSTFWRCHVMVIDWNPLGAPGTPSRVHQRLRLLSAFDFLKSSGGTAGGIYESGTFGSNSMMYLPRTRELLYYSTTAAGVTLDAGESKVIFLSPSPAFQGLTEPSANEEIATGKVITFGVEASGSLGEKIGGIGMNFQLRRISTVQEVLATTPTPGETVTLANTVSPTDPAASPIKVYEDGVELTETTHFTLNRGSSQITFVSPKPLSGPIYTATYRHFGTPVSPPHGSLLATSGTTGNDGVALTRVRYDEEDPVPDRWDRLDADQA